MFIKPAFAQEAATTAAGILPSTGEGNLFMSMLPIFLVMLVFYFMVIRPQSRRMGEHRAMIEGLKKGDKVVTGGGLVATVVKLIGTEEVLLQLNEGIEVKALRSTIMMMRHPEDQKKA